jgi:polar amino acid transport system substrate-binding protein
MPGFKSFFPRSFALLAPGLLTGIVIGSTGVILLSPTLAQTKPALESEAIQLKVGVVGRPPFVIYEPNENTDVSGISVDVWKNISLAEQWESKYIPQKNVKQGLEALSEGKLDILIGSISITPERVSLPNIRFSQPYFNGSVGVMVPTEAPSPLSRLAPFFRIAALSSFGGLALLIFIMGNLIWVAEHRKNPDHFSPNYHQGLQSGMWFALVTLTTVGYGDRYPITKSGKIITSVWMIVALLTFSSITAGLASAFTAALSEGHERPSMTRASDLQGASVAVIENTTSEEWAKFYRAKARPTKTLPDAIALLKLGKVQALIFDRPVLMYYVNQHPDEKVYVTDLKLAIEPYGFVMPTNSQLETELNVRLLNLVYGKEMERITERWLGAELLDLQ